MIRVKLPKGYATWDTVSHYAWFHETGLPPGYECVSFAWEKNRPSQLDMAESVAIVIAEWPEV